MFMFVCVCAHVWVYVWGPEVDESSPVTLYFAFWDRVYHWTWSSSICWDLLASEPQGIHLSTLPFPHPQHWGYSAQLLCDSGDMNFGPHACKGEHFMKLANSLTLAWLSCYCSGVLLPICHKYLSSHSPHCVSLGCLSIFSICVMFMVATFIPLLVFFLWLAC